MVQAALCTKGTVYIYSMFIKSAVYQREVLALHAAVKHYFAMIGSLLFLIHRQSYKIFMKLNKMYHENSEHKLIEKVRLVHLFLFNF